MRTDTVGAASAQSQMPNTTRAVQGGAKTIHDAHCCSTDPQACNLSRHVQGHNVAQTQTIHVKQACNCERGRRSVIAR
eukprot:8460110-Lingulodinium_polyedra.AAC.1